MTDPRSRSAYRLVVESPVGPLLLAGTAEALTELRFGDRRAARRWMRGRAPAPPVLREAARQLEAYFAGRLRAFRLPLAPEGTPFQQAVWKALLGIPYGETLSYGEVARRIGKPSACRAVGAANRANPVAVVIPCHRVIGADGSLTGYAGRLAVKRFLLELEGALRA